MTAPLTPHDQQPFPHGPGPTGARASVGRELLVALLVVALTAVAGVVLGFVWLHVAPRVPLISDGSAIYLKDAEGEQAVGADGWFTLLGLGMGVLCALVAFWRRRSGGVALVVGLGIGGVVASVIAWRLGVWLGPTSNVIAHAKAVGVNKVFDAPLVLHAKGALLAWPIGSVLGFLALVSLFTSEPAPAPWPGWDGGDDGPQSVSGAHWVSYTPTEQGPAHQPEHPGTASGAEPTSGTEAGHGAEADRGAEPDRGAEADSGAEAGPGVEGEGASKPSGDAEADPEQGKGQDRDGNPGHGSDGEPGPDGEGPDTDTGGKPGQE